MAIATRALTLLEYKTQNPPPIDCKIWKESASGLHIRSSFKMLIDGRTDERRMHAYIISSQYEPLAQLNKNITKDHDCNQTFIFSSWLFGIACSSVNDCKNAS